jgi:glycosyltransferase involved in cell wall biosynthesis
MSDKSAGQTSTRNNQAKPIKVGYVLAYRDNRYIRTAVLTRAIALSPRLELLTAINQTKGFLRYADTTLRLIKLRVTARPDVYIFGFRSHESFWLFRIITIGKPVIFDEFINMQNSLVTEKSVIKPKGVGAKFAKWYVRSLHRASHLILTDTKLHAESSSREYGTGIEKFKPLYVGCDEQLFYPRKTQRNSKLQVFFYGNVEALHGLNHILGAIQRLNNDQYEFTIIGGRGKPEVKAAIDAVQKAAPKAVINYIEWVPIEELPDRIAAADICLGGPFGDTAQARVVITGKTFQFLAMGKPAIIGTIEQESGFVDRKNCLLVRQGSSEAIADQLAWAAAHKSKLADIGAEARELFDRRFSTSVISKELESIIIEATQKI